MKELTFVEFLWSAAIIFMLIHWFFIPTNVVGDYRRYKEKTRGKNYKSETSYGRSVSNKQ